MLKPKKVFSIVKVKNDGDIIESFVRDSIVIFDGIIILDNESTDSTAKILEQLKDEGLNVFIFRFSDYDQSDEINKLLLNITQEFKIDVIIPLNLADFTRIFDLENKIAEIKDNEDLWDLDFCKNITTINSTANLLKSYEWLSLTCLNLKKEKFSEEKRLKRKIEELSLEIYDFYNEKNSEEKQLRCEIEEYKNKLESQKQFYEGSLQVLEGEKGDLFSKLESQRQLYEEKLQIQKQFYSGKLQKQKRLVREIRSSNSWKLTKNFRRIGKTLKSLK